MHLGKLACRSHEKLHRLKNCHKKKEKTGGGGAIPGVIWWEGEWTWHPCVWTVGGCWRTWKESLQTQTTHKRNSTISNIKQIHTHTVWGCKRTFLLKKDSMGNESLRTQWPSFAAMETATWSKKHHISVIIPAAFSTAKNNSYFTYWVF